MLVDALGNPFNLMLTPGATLELRVDGPTAQGAGPVADNLVLKAAGALAARAGSLRTGCFLLTKQLPVAAGLGAVLFLTQQQLFDAWIGYVPALVPAATTVSRLFARGASSPGAPIASA